MADKSRQEKFSEALLGKNIPILTLDNKWYRLLDEGGRAMVKDLEEELNALLKRQGKLNTETKEIRRLKKKLMNDIVTKVDELSQSNNSKLEKEIEDNKRLIAECNEKLESYQEELIDLPRAIDQINIKLMLFTMEYCYDTMRDNEEQINAIAEWVAQVRVELKKNLVRKQEMEYKNQEIYAYMNDVFGAEVMDLFDAQYKADESHK